MRAQDLSHARRSSAASDNALSPLCAQLGHIHNPELHVTHRADYAWPSRNKKRKQQRRRLSAQRSTVNNQPMAPPLCAQLGHIHNPGLHVTHGADYAWPSWSIKGSNNGVDRASSARRKTGNNQPMRSLDHRPTYTAAKPQPQPGVTRDSWTADA
jgi:hypothetical protein